MQYSLLLSAAWLNDVLPHQPCYAAARDVARAYSMPLVCTRSNLMPSPVPQSILAFCLYWLLSTTFFSLNIQRPNVVLDLHVTTFYQH